MTNKNNPAIKKLAESLLELFDKSTSPLDELLAENELQVYYDNYEQGTFDGMTIFDDGEFFIHLNLDNGNKPNSQRGRFTLAHELGHYFIESHRIGLKRGMLSPHASFANKSQHYLIEREADYFAACLLMPERQFKQDVERKKFGTDVIEFLTQKYNVSKTACLLRFIDIGNHPIHIVYAENSAIKWHKCSEDFPYKRLLYDKQVPEETVMGEYFKNIIDSNTYSQETVWAIDWFNYVSDEDSSRKFYEYCISYKNKTLSIIWEE